MTAELITLGQSTWRFAPEAPRPLADNIQALVYADTIDEITQAPPGAPIEVTTGNAGINAQASRSGRAGLIGRPSALFTPATVSTTTLSMSVNASGFLPRAWSGTLGAQPPTYPDDFSPMNLGAIALHRTPLTISGRTVAQDRTPLAGSTITINDVWATQASLTTAGIAANLLAITPGLYSDQPTTASVSAYNVVPQTAQAKQLLFSAGANAKQIRLSDQLGLASGGVLVIEWPDKDRSEIVGIVAITDGGVTPDQPATIVLAQGLSRPHNAGAPAYPGSAAALGAANAIAVAGQIGDVTLSLGGMNGLDTSTTAIEISGGGAPAEYHWASVYQINSDANGYFSLPPIHRFAQIQLHATNAALSLDYPVALDFGRSDLVADLILS